MLELANTIFTNPLAQPSGQSRNFDVDFSTFFFWRRIKTVEISTLIWHWIDVAHWSFNVFFAIEILMLLSRRKCPLGRLIPHPGPCPWSLAWGTSLQIPEPKDLSLRPLPLVDPKHEAHHDSFRKMFSTKSEQY